MKKTFGIHIVRFGFACITLAVVPLYSLSPLPFSSAARMLTLPLMLIFCFSGAAVVGWGFIVKIVSRFTGSRSRLRFALIAISFQLLLILTFGGLSYVSHLGSWLLIGGAAAVALGGGAWALGGVLQWLWTMSDPNKMARQGRPSRIVRGYPLARKVASRG